MKNKLLSEDQLKELEALKVFGGKNGGIDPLSQTECSNEAAGCGSDVDQTKCVNTTAGCGSSIQISCLVDPNKGCTVSPFSNCSCPPPGS